MPFTLLAARAASKPFVQFFNRTRSSSTLIILTPLHATVLSGSAHARDIISVLLQHGADVNAQTRGEENTALHLLVEQGEFPRDFSLVLRLMENGVDLSIRNKKLRTAYDCAMGKNMFELAATLDGSLPPAQASQIYEEKIGQKYAPYIIAAVLRSDKTMLEENVRLGGNPNSLNKHGAGAIHYAVTHCTLPLLDVLQILVHAGADVNLRDDEGDNALNLAIKSDKLRQAGQMLDVVQFLVDYGSDPNFKDLDGKDAFQMAEERGYQDVLRILKAPRHPKLTPREEDVVEPKPEPQPPPQPVPQPALEPQQPNPDPKPVQKEEFPDPNAPNDDGLFPIHLATKRDNSVERSALIDSLLKRGARVSQITAKEGNTALHLCAMLNRADSAKQLLDHQIDYTLKNQDGKTALMVARDRGSQEVAKAIEAKVAQMKGKSQQNKDGNCIIL